MNRHPISDAREDRDALAGELESQASRCGVKPVGIIDGEPEFTTPRWLSPLAIAVAVSGIALAWLTYSRRVISADLLAAIFAPIRRAALARFWLDDLFEGLYRGALLGMSAAVDGVVNVLSAWTLTWGDRLRRMQSGLPQDYVYGLAVGLLLLLIWVQWPR